VRGRLGSPVAALLVLVAFLPNPCHAQATVDSLTVAWAEFATGSAFDSLGAVGVLVPRQLAAALSFVSSRFCTAAETTAASQRTAADQLEAARDDVAKARRARDLVALSTGDHARRIADLAAAEGSVAKAERALAALLDSASRDSGPPVTGTDTASSHRQVAAAAPRTLKMLAADTNGMLLKPPENPAQTCASKKIDMLVHGSIRMVGSFVAIDAALYLASVGRDVWNATEYAAPDGIDAAVTALARPLAEAMLGKPFSLIRYEVTPAYADMAIDGKPATDAIQLFFAAGTHEASARAPGFSSRSVSFDVEPGNDTTVELRLDPLDAVGFSISSQPEGARVHVDGAFVGQAPVAVPPAAYPRVGRISMPGYGDVQIIIRPDAILDDQNIIMVPSDGLIFDARFDKAKDKFYRSLGWFVVSLPLPVLSGGLFQNYYQTAGQYLADHPSPDPAITESINSRFYGWQAAFWASAAISAGLAINAIISLIGYIGSAR